MKRSKPMSSSHIFFFHFSNVIDVSAIDSQTMEQHEYMDRARQYRFDISNKILILKIRLKKNKYAFQ